jgi:hypothetical protein
MGWELRGWELRGWNLEWDASVTGFLETVGMLYS